jgi:exonuclease III
MVSFLFWNLGQRPLQEGVARIVSEHSIDVVMLAECESSQGSILSSLNQKNQNAFSIPFSQSERITILTRFPPSTLKPVFDDPGRRLTVRRLIVQQRTDILVAVVHFHSRRNWSDEDQMIESTMLAADLKKQEDDFGHRRTVLVGDLNMNPFDKGVVAAGGLHAVMTRSTARRGTRTVAARTYPFFYNPMWGFFGDRTEGPPGTHYFVGKHVSYFWNIYDQVLLRPELMDSLVELKILDSDGCLSLLSADGFPNKTTGSDHLPVLFRLDL